MFENNKNNIGKIERRLSIKGLYSYRRSWRWKRQLFSKMRIDASGMNPHMVIVGESGSGKSNLSKLIVGSLAARGAKVAILDPHNEYLGIADSIGAEVYDARYNGINIMDLDGLDVKEKASELTALFKKVFRLGDVQSYTLYRCISYSYYVMDQRDRTPTMRDLIYSVKVFKRHAGKSESNVLEGLERRLSLVDNGRGSDSVQMQRVMNGNSVLLLGSLHTPEAQTVYIEAFLRKVYSTMLSSEKSSRPLLYILIDEAERVSESKMLGKLAAEGRKYGIGIIAISQRAKSISKSLRSNSSLFMTFYQREPEELNYMANLIAGGNELNRFAEVKKGIRHLRRGQAMVLDSRESEPYVVSFARCGEDAINIGYTISSLAREPIREPELMEELKRRGASEDESSEKIDQMLLDKTLGMHVIGADSAYDGTWYVYMPRNSPEHEIRVRVMARYLKEQGVQCAVYDSAYGPDIMVRTGKRIAVEYETGMKRLEDTARMIEGRKAKYDSIVVVVNDLHADRYKDIDGIMLMPFSKFMNEGAETLKSI
ncbi:MAG: ATP-binding protein [Candidatus Micrarchaeota archaeon]|nr:ATP-binding protein [Candidatus Micrarchaeota archaeon]